MAKQACLIIIKPDGLVKSVTGNIINELSKAELQIIGAKIVSVKKELAEQHYAELKDKKPEVYESTLKYIMGHFHTPRVLALVYYGEDAVKKIRNIVGSTNPEEAHPTTIRGRYGRINSKNQVMENCIHASDSEASAEKEIKLWFEPEEIVVDLYPTKIIKQEQEKQIWA
ncbi:MAG: nucleoside-diphosphate kinase [Candidatus Nanoarchaeia archaeon]